MTQQQPGRGVKILAIGDPYLDAEIIAGTLGRFVKGAEVTAVDWELPDLAELAFRNRRIEREGPDESLLTENIARALRAGRWDAIVTHFAPLAAAAVAQLEPGAWIGVLRAGTENVDLDLCRRHRVPVFSTPGRNANAVAEFALGMILAETRQIARAHERFRRGEWEKSFGRPLPRELRSLVIGIVGFGAVGRLLAQKLVALGSRVLVCDPYVGEEAMAGLPGDRARKVGLDDLLKESDVVTLHARSDGSGPLIGERELALMRPDAILVNTARAELVDEEAVLRALEHRRIRGVAFDVYRDEPPPADSPWRSAEQATLTPHMGGATLDAFTRSPEVLCDIVSAYLRRGERRGVVVEPAADGIAAFRDRWSALISEAAASSFA